MKVNKFWNWARDADDNRVLYFDGVIAEESWWGDEITPKVFKDELSASGGDITIWLNSPGGDCIAASRIYSMLMDYKGNITVKVDGIAASAASVIAMAGTSVLMAPTSLMMIHNPLTIAIGDGEEMLRAKGMLDEVKESIINAYEIKTCQGRDTLSNLMDAETWLSAHKAVELGFADGILEDEKHMREKPESGAAADTYAFSRRAVVNSLLDKVIPKGQTETETKPKPTPQGVMAESLEKRLFLITH